MELTLGSFALPDGSCRFRVWAPLRRSVAVRLGDRLVSLDDDGDGNFTGIVPHVPIGSRYFYRLDDAIDRPDPASRHQPEGVHGPSAVIAPSFRWTDDVWRNVPWDASVLYELHVGTFTPEGTFDAVIPRLDDLKDLGVTTIELMPIAQFPGHRNWGYDGVYPFAAQSTYGGPDGLRRLVDAAHARGLAVVLDVVYNHLGPEGNYLSAFGPYFHRLIRTDWGEAFNFDDEHSDHVRRYFLENAVSWFRDFHLDGLRLDAVNYIRDGSPVHFLEELGDVIAAEEARRGRSFYLIAESLMNDPRMMRSRGDHGHGMTASWCDDLHHALHALVTGERHGYFEDFGGLEHLARAYRQGYHFDGQFSKYRRRRHGRPPVGLEANHFVVYSQNHDQTGNRALGDRLSTLVDVETLKLLAAAVILSPNVPMLFMGEEYGETAPFPFFISHGDPHLIDAVRNGRLHEFVTHKWKDAPPDPADEATFRSAMLNWDRRETSELLDWYRRLLRLRRETPALANLRFGDVSVRIDGGILTVTRRHPTGDVAIALRFGGEWKETPAGRILIESERVRVAR